MAFRILGCQYYEVFVFIVFACVPCDGLMCCRAALYLVRAGTGSPHTVLDKQVWAREGFDTWLSSSPRW